MENLPIAIDILFIATLLFALYLFYKAIRPSRWVLLVLLGWLCLQAILGFNHFYTEWNILPPRFIFLVGPPLLVIVMSFLIPGIRKKLDNLNPMYLTLIHSVRIPVEITLLLLFIHKQVPQLMTFEGRNWDILSGISALAVVYFGYQKKLLNKTVLLIWNFCGLALLINIVANAILAAPFPFQQFAFDQPNVAVAYFPYVWLPSFIVPIVLFAHLVAIRQLFIKKDRQAMSEKVLQSKTLVV